MNNSEEKVMKRLIYILPILATLVCVFTSCEEISYDTTGSISGVVLDNDTGAPIRGVMVSLVPEGKGERVTEEDGRFEFTQLLTGSHQYTVTARKEGYRTNRIYVTVEANANVEVSLILDKI